MTALISSALADLARSKLGLFRVHTATITPSTEGAEDIYHDAVDTPGTPRTSVACKYVPADTLRVDEDGRATIKAPTLTVAYDDVLAVGDRVSNVQDASGAVLAAGPLAVQSIVPAAGLGYSLKKTAILAGAGVAE